MGLVGRIATLLVASGTIASLACSDTAKPIGSGDKLINDTMGQPPVGGSQPPQYPPMDGGYEGGYAPALNTCGSCSCDPSKNYCFSGGTRKARLSYPFGSGGAGFGEPDGAAEAGPPPPPCKVLDAGATGDGCIPLPASCASNPTCECLLTALQPLYTCYLVCTPSPGFLQVYCPHGP